jgi:hypothetical protein
MALRVNFSRKLFRQKLEEFSDEIEDRLIIKLNVIGFKCVNMSRESVGINASAFPVSDPNAQNPKPLRQRRRTKKEIESGRFPQDPVFGDYLNQTGNLRNSIGYFILKDGVIIEDHGDNKARIIAEEVASSSGISLIVVAGMDYAAAVEAKGYNVITSSKLFAETEVAKQLQKLVREIKKNEITD